MRSTTAGPPPRPRAGAAVGALLVAAGVVAIALGCWGAADAVTVAEQVPFVVSGGLGGLALVILGAALMLVDAARERAREELAAHEALVAEADELVVVAAHRRPTRPVRPRRSKSG